MPVFYLVALLSAIVSPRVFAEFIGDASISAKKLTGTTVLCTREPTLLEKGGREGTLNRTSKIGVYFGPSVLCPTLGQLDTSIAFKVIGGARSRFGKQWAYIETISSKPERAWIPSKYILFGEFIKPEVVSRHAQTSSKAQAQDPSKPELSSKDIPLTKIRIVRDLSVRECPHTSCRLLSTVPKGREFSTNKISHDGWYEIAVSKSVLGWVSGKHSEIMMAQPNSSITRENKIETVTVEIIEKPDLFFSWASPVTKTPAIQLPQKALVPITIPEYCEIDKDDMELVSKSFFQVKSRIELYENNHPLCVRRFPIKRDSALVLLAQSESFYQFAYMKPFEAEYSEGFIQKNYLQEQIKNRSVPRRISSKQNLSSALTRAQSYWQSWEATFDNALHQTCLFYDKHKPLSYVVTLLIVVGAMWSFSKSRRALIAASTMLFGIIGLAFKQIYKWLSAFVGWIIRLLFFRQIQSIDSHWNTMVQGLEISPREFYGVLERSIQEKSLPKAKTVEVFWKEGGFWSANRLYLRIKRKEFAFDVCCAPYGNGTFFSYWMGGFAPLLLNFLYKIPVLSWFAYALDKLFSKDSYWHYDTMIMFRSLVHAAILESVDHFVSEKGLPPVAAEERKPKMKDLFGMSSA